MDPLSIPGGVVGIISLGIQIGQGLVSYLESFKGQDQEIKESLAEVQSLVSVFQSLQGILPKVDRFCAETNTLRRCLADSEEKLHDFQTFLLKLRGPPKASESTLERMDHARRALVYPFREGKLKSLRQSLQELLHNLNVSIGLTSVDLGVEICDRVSSLGDDVKDHGVQLTQLSNQLQTLNHSMGTYYIELKKDLSRAERFMEDFRQEVGGKLTLLSNDMGSIVSTNQHFQDAFSELTAQKGFQQKLLMSEFGMESLALSTPGSRRKVTPKRPGIAEDPTASLPGCDCVLELKPWKLSYKFWNAKFEYEQHGFGQHRRSCKYFGIDKATKRNIKAELPLKLNWLSTRVMLTCMEYSLGTGNPGFSFRYKNVVPIEDSPVLTEICNLQISMGEPLRKLPRERIISLFSGAERAILSLYKDGKASPSDRAEEGMCHVVMAYEIIQDLYIDLNLGQSSFHFIREALDMAAVSFMKTLVGLVGVDSGIILSPYIQYMSNDNEQLLLPYLAETFTLDWGKMIKDALGVNSASLKRVETWLCNSEDFLELPPVAQAIFQESMNSLEACLSKRPESVYERPFGLTTLQACIQWPEGLQKLINSKAQDLVDEDLLLLAIQANRIESVDIILKAGCPLTYGAKMEKMFYNSSSQCMAVIASNLAQRRRDLLSMAQARLGIFQHFNASADTADAQSASICRLLDQSRIPIPPAIRVPPTYSTIYHFYGTVPWHYAIFYGHGFSDLHSSNNMGLLPIMAHSRFDFTTEIHYEESRTRDTIAWLEKEGVMDQTPVDLLSLGLNEHATGWHYFGSFIGESSRIEPLDYIFKAAPRDCCVCWCNIPGRGCSPLNTCLKSRATRERHKPPFHYYFHRSIGDKELNGSQISDYCLDFVRFLTFEALEMTHTCCEITDIHRPGQSPERPLVILDCDMEKVRRTRSDKQEQQLAALLESLMEDFIEYLSHMDPSPRSLETFITGYWRWRMSEVFAVNPDVLNGMEGCGISIRTHILPERAQILLGKDFELIKPDKQNQESPKISPTGGNSCEERESFVEESVCLPACWWCNNNNKTSRRLR